MPNDIIATDLTLPQVARSASNEFDHLIASNSDLITLQIQHHIAHACNNEGVTCLHAIESGSRAWGFASPDSDYDVRLIYHHPLDWYLTLYAGRDTFEFIDDAIFAVPFDIGGWDLRKALQLLYKSNAVIFEWLNSPIVYQSEVGFIKQIQAVQGEFFDPKAIFYHYQGLANNSQRTLTLAEPIRLKKWFYLLRALLASVWVVERASVPPVAMTEMLELISAHEREQISELMRIKSAQDEGHREILSPALLRLTEQLWQRCDSPTFAPKRQGDVRILEALFRQVVVSHSP